MKHTENKKNGKKKVALLLLMLFLLGSSAAAGFRALSSAQNTIPTAKAESVLPQRQESTEDIHDTQLPLANPQEENSEENKTEIRVPVVEAPGKAPQVNTVETPVTPQPAPVVPDENHVIEDPSKEEEKDEQEETLPEEETSDEEEEKKETPEEGESVPDSGNANEETNGNQNSEKEEVDVPVIYSTVAEKWYAEASDLLARFNACSTKEEQKKVLEATNMALNNDAFRAKLLKDNGGEWDQLEAKVVSATQYQQGKTFYVQVYMAKYNGEFTPVIYATQNKDTTGNQWATNLVYNPETKTWNEYVKKHPYNNGRESFGMHSLNNSMSWEELKETMAVSEKWEEVTAEA